MYKRGEQLVATEGLKPEDIVGIVHENGQIQYWSISAILSEYKLILSWPYRDDLLYSTLNNDTILIFSYRPKGFFCTIKSWFKE